jgi:hypothetical protein
MKAKELAAHYRAKAAQTRARLLAIKRADLCVTVLGVAQTYESWAREIEKSAGKAGEADASERRGPRPNRRLHRARRQERRAKVERFVGRKS